MIGSGQKVARNENCSLKMISESDEKKREKNGVFVGFYVMHQVVIFKRAIMVKRRKKFFIFFFVFWLKLAQNTNSWIWNYRFKSKTKWTAIRQNNWDFLLPLRCYIVILPIAHRSQWKMFIEVMLTISSLFLPLKFIDKEKKLREKTAKYSWNNVIFFCSAFSSSKRWTNYDKKIMYLDRWSKFDLKMKCRASEREKYQ